MIRFKNVKFIYDNQNDMSIQIDHLKIGQGECVVLCGESGSGKTSLIRMINGLIPEYYTGALEGDIDIDTYRSGVDSIEDIARTVGTVFQNPATQFFHKIIEHELVFPCENQGIHPDEIQQRLQTTAAFFSLGSMLGSSLYRASGGERQRVAVATAMMQKPKIVVLDEPTANLDYVGVLQIATYIEKLKNDGMTVVIAEHRLNFLKNIADRYVYIKDGRVKYEWNKVQWLELSHNKRSELGLRGVNTAHQYSDNKVSQSRGLKIKDLNLSVFGRNLGTIKEVQFPVNCITALTGKNGIGKSSLANIISGLDKSDGIICFDEKEMKEKDRLENTAFVMQEVRLQLFSESVEKEIKLGLKEFSQFEEIIQKLGLTELLKRHPMSLSGGQMQRVMIASALLSNKKIFIFDEPTSGLDYRQMIHFAELLKALKTDDIVIIVITHDIELIEVLCDQVINLETIFNDELVLSESV